jgi:hypothetical protein
VGSKVFNPKRASKKESRRNKDNKGSTSNLYALLNPKPKDKNSDDKNKGVSDRYPGCTTDTLTIPILKTTI